MVHKTREANKRHKPVRNNTETVVCGKKLSQMKKHDAAKDKVEEVQDRQPTIVDKKKQDHHDISVSTRSINVCENESQK